ncbi:scavenger receptor cysteine-rich type 1 protein M130-like [Triplophysa dalaica]|uniref:scavenger receptor cysteine-rich type 1 protein M130-like n=1 Tax=Triplophysa dalaica TaxID=1582913 RepID=UPI0024E016AC|nr:scavenger receptor cysteine-rich type 1 protein M130-like [Triplophysa dalaica]
MGCGPLKEENQRSFFGDGTLLGLMTKVECVGTESSLIDCPSDKEQRSCDNKNAGVICAANVRLIDGFDSCSGRVEVFKDGQWGTVCDDGWDLSDASVVCREVGCGDAIEVKRGGYFGQGSGGPIKIHRVNCAGSELMLSSCVSDDGAVDPKVCDISKTAGVICQSLVRLVNGDNSCSGRVEVYHDRRWGTVCDSELDSWGSIDGQVVCREVGCGDIIRAEGHAYFGKGSGPIWLSYVRCSGLETTVRYCGSRSLGDNICQHDSDAGVLCKHPVRLTGGSTCSGVVEVYRGGLWGPVCYDGWDLTDAAVVCRELGCEDVIEVNSSLIQGPAVMNNVDCDGSESTLMRCGWSAQNCSSNRHATVTCRSIKVVNGSNQCSGTVLIFHNGRWGSVCDNGWDVSDAQVVCRELGCARGEAKVQAYFGLLEQKSWMAGVGCTGNERSLIECSSKLGSDLCGPENYAGVICEEMTFKYRLRIEVKGDPSDPAVRDIILRKIQEKVHSHGNFTLSWKTHSNGTIFQPKNTFDP